MFIPLLSVLQTNDNVCSICLPLLSVLQTDDNVCSICLPLLSVLQYVYTFTFCFTVCLYLYFLFYSMFTFTFCFTVCLYLYFLFYRQMMTSVDYICLIVRSRTSNFSAIWRLLLFKIISERLSIFASTYHALGEGAITTHFNVLV
jgi:hypothetical protein